MSDRHKLTTKRDATSHQLGVIETVDDKPPKEWYQKFVEAMEEFETHTLPKEVITELDLLLKLSEQICKSLRRIIETSKRNQKPIRKNAKSK